MSHSVVIGGAGFIGSWVVDEILKDPQNTVTVIDNLLSSEIWNLSNDVRVTFIQGSATDFSTFDKITRPIDYLYQLACFHGNQNSITRPIEDLEHGTKTTLTTLEWIKNNSSKTKIVYSGAGCTIASKTWDKPEPVKEVDVTSLIHDSPYSISKITGEMYCLFYAKFHNLNVVRVRFQNVYGPREILGAGDWRGNPSTIWRNVIPTFIWKSLENVDLEVFGESTRDFIFVRDIAEGILLASKHGKQGEAYNLASGKEVKIHELAKAIKSLCGSKSKIIISEKRIWDNSGRRVGDTQKSENDLGFIAKTSLTDGLDETINWTQNNLGRIMKTIHKHANF